MAIKANKNIKEVKLSKHLVYFGVVMFGVTKKVPKTYTTTKYVKEVVRIIHSLYTPIFHLLIEFITSDVFWPFTGKCFGTQEFILK